MTSGGGVVVVEGMEEFDAKSISPIRFCRVSGTIKRRACSYLGGSVARGQFEANLNP